MRRVVLVIITFSLLLFSCKKKQQAQQINNHPVPSVPVDITLYPNDPLNFTLQGIGGWKYLFGGVNGIIVYRKSEQEFIALERSSAFYPSNPAALAIVQPDNFTCKDTVSGSKWQIIDGTIIQGPAEWPLRGYSTNYDGTVLRIRN